MSNPCAKGSSAEGCSVVEARARTLRTALRTAAHRSTPRRAAVRVGCRLRRHRCVLRCLWHRRQRRRQRVRPHASRARATARTRTRARALTPSSPAAPSQLRHIGRLQGAHRQEGVCARRGLRDRGRHAGRHGRLDHHPEGHRRHQVLRRRLLGPGHAHVRLPRRRRRRGLLAAAGHLPRDARLHHALVRRRHDRHDHRAQGLRLRRVARGDQRG